MAITNNRDATRSQSFTYDQLNRLATAKTSSTTGTNCWGETFSYDIWANLLSIGAVSGYTGCTQENLSITVTTSNRVSGDTYDASGNLTIIPGTGGASYAYNAESQLTSANGISYTYDGDGRRVQKSSGKLYWYGMSDDVLDETDASGNLTNEYIFFGGKRIARRDSSGNVNYYFADHLGTARIVTNATGTVLDDSDFYPFGGERVVVASSGNTYKFTGKERDSESGLDDFGARFYASGLGRFLTPDWSSKPLAVPYAQFGDPQSLNLYGYVENAPLNRVDPDGHWGFNYITSSGQVLSNVCLGENANCSAPPPTPAQKPPQNQPATAPPPQPQSSGTATFNLGGVTVTFSWAIYTESQGRGVEIEATPKGCDSCVWAQTVNGPDIKGGTKADTQPGADPKKYPFTAPTETPGQLYDRPERSAAPASLNFVSTMGTAAGKTFDVKGSLTWGFSVNKSGQVEFTGVRLATPAEQKGSLAIWRRATGMETAP